MPFPVALAAAVAPSLIKGVSGLFGIGKGNRMAKNNPFPTANVNENIIKNSVDADQMARIGLPTEQYNLGLQNIGRNQASALNQLSRSNNSSAGLQSLLRASNDATLNLDNQNAQARLRNQGVAMQQRGALANEQNRVWDWNQRQRYLQQANAAAAVKGAGLQNAFGSLTDLSQLGQSYFGGQNGTGSLFGGRGKNQLGDMQPGISVTPAYKSQFNGLV